MLFLVKKMKLNTCKLGLISVFTGVWIYVLLRKNEAYDKAFSKETSKSKDNSLVFGNNHVLTDDPTIETGLSHKLILSLDRTTKNEVLQASHEKFVTRSDEDEIRHTQSQNNSIQGNINQKLVMHENSNTNGKNAISPKPDYPLFQPAEEVDFPTSDKNQQRIPHIIHQMYADEMIPEMYINHVKSFIRHNPTWQYRFWTDASGRRLLEKFHPYLLKVYDNFGNNVKRSDLLRYAVIYEYGGFYADLDMDNLRSLNRTTMKYACIVSVEPFEHSALLNNMAFLMNNAILSCRPKHPFFKLLLSDLAHADPQGYPVGTTGPGYVTKKFVQYNHIGSVNDKRNKTDWTSNSPYFYKGELREDGNNSVYVPNSQYFMDTLDPIHIKEDGKFVQLCKNVEALSYLKKRACSEFYQRKGVRERQKYTFTVHHWYHLWEMKKTTVKDLKKINITEIVPNCTFYNG